MKEKGHCPKCDKEKVIYFKGLCQKCYRESLANKEEKQYFSTYIGKSKRVQTCVEMIINKIPTEEICEKLYYSANAVYRIKSKWIREKK